MKCVKYFITLLYSGVMSSENDLPPKVPVPELVTSTGVAYIHFYSDTLYNMSGFNISYRYAMNYMVIILNHEICINNDVVLCVIFF